MRKWPCRGFKFIEPGPRPAQGVRRFHEGRSRWAENAVGALRRVERAMTKADQFRECAEEAMRWSRQSRTEEENTVLIDLAFTWTRAASLSERKFGSAGAKGLTPLPETERKLKSHLFAHYRRVGRK
jgi:hypothetical protein